MSQENAQAAAEEVFDAIERKLWVLLALSAVNILVPGATLLLLIKKTWF